MSFSCTTLFLLFSSAGLIENCVKFVPTVAPQELPRRLNDTTMLMISTDNLKVFYNCSKGKLTIREPTPRNLETEYWCTALALNNREYDVRTQACNNIMYDNDPAFSSAPESQVEMDDFVGLSVKLIEEMASLKTMKTRTFETWTVVIGGSINPLCKPLGTCPFNESFSLVDPRTDPTYIMNNWMEGQPDNRTYNGTTKDCLGFDQDGKVRNIFCEGSHSPFNKADGNTEYRIQGFTCGHPPQQLVEIDNKIYSI